MLKLVLTIFIGAQWASAAQRLGDYETELLSKAQQKALQKSARVIEETDEHIIEEFILLGHGPIVEVPSHFRYGNEYVLTVTRETQFEPGAKSKITLELSLLELTYCHFKYANSDLNRFRRRSLNFNERLELTEAHTFTRVYDPATNGKCISGKTENERHSEEPLKLTPELLTELQFVLKSLAK